MSSIKIVDAKMGRGKSSAAIRYMNQTKNNKRFLYVTPYLDEVDRVCEQCGFDQPGNDHTTKSAELKLSLKEGRSVAATHSLFCLMDKEAIELVRDKQYSLIVDESIRVIERLNITTKDLEFVTSTLASVDESGYVHWEDPGYVGRFSDYKKIADAGSLFRLDSVLMNILNPELLRAFDEVFILTYLFEGQYPKAYLDFFEFDYQIIGVEKDELGYRFSDKPDAPPSLDYSKLIHIVENKRMNAIGKNDHALSKGWYSKRSYGHEDIKALRNGMRNFFRSSGESSDSRMWTCFKRDMDKLIDAKTGRFRKNFVQTGARATNKYRNRTNAAYMVNRFVDPSIMKFFRKNGVTIDQDAFALSEMLQWIWRSAIRDDKPISLYVPSKRMRDLLTDWINNEKGFEKNEQK